MVADTDGPPAIVTLTGRSSSISRHAVVLDLDETLLHTMPNGTEALENTILTSPGQLEVRGRLYHLTISDLFRQRGTGQRSDFWGVKRPHLNLFLAFCFDYFRYVVVWSAGQKPYVTAVVDEIFKGIGRPDIIYSYDDCVKLPDDNYHKPLSVLLNDPRLGGRLVSSSVLFVDDRVGNFIESGSNAIIIPRYKPAPTVSALAADDYALLQLRQWLLREDVTSSPDVRQLHKGDIFSTPVSSSPPRATSLRVVPNFAVNPLFTVTSPLSLTLDHYYDLNSTPGGLPPVVDLVPP